MEVQVCQPQKTRYCATLSIVCIQSGPRKLSVIRSSGVSAIEGLRIELNGRTVGTFRINCPLYCRWHTHALQSDHSSGLRRETSISTHALQSDHSSGLRKETSVSTHALQSDHSSGLRRETRVSTHVLQSEHSSCLRRETRVFTHALQSDQSSGLWRETVSPYCYKLSMLHNHT